MANPVFTIIQDHVFWKHPTEPKNADVAACDYCDEHEARHMMTPRILAMMGGRKDG